MATKKLARTVTVFDEEAGQYTTYNAGDEVPENHAKLITNEKVWESEEQQEDMGPPPGEAQMRTVSEEEVEKRATATQSTESGAPPAEAAPERQEEPKQEAKKSGPKDK